MSQKVEQWMRDAALEYLQQAHPDLMEDMINELSAIIASHAPSDHLSLELADRDRIIKGLIADNERLVAESYVAGMGDGAKLARASEAAAQPACNCGADRTGPTAEAHAADCPVEIADSLTCQHCGAEYEEFHMCLDTQETIEHNDH